MDLFNVFNQDFRLPLISDLSKLLPGKIDQPEKILVISDIHANIFALKAVFEDAQGKYDAIWFLGDLLGYGPYPELCCDFFLNHMQQITKWIPGNHDLGVMDCSQTVGGLQQSDVARATWNIHYKELSNNENLKNRYISLLEQTKHIENGQNDKFMYTLVHANPRTPAGEYLYPNEGYKQLEALKIGFNISQNGHHAQWLLVGHSHMVFLTSLPLNDELPHMVSLQYGKPISISQGKYIINPGSVGLPRDGDPRASYAILDQSQGLITFYRVKYPIESLYPDMEGYPNVLIENFRTGRVSETWRWDWAYTREDFGHGIIAR